MGEGTEQGRTVSETRAVLQGVLCWIAVTIQEGTDSFRLNFSLEMAVTFPHNRIPRYWRLRILQEASYKFGVSGHRETGTVRADRDSRLDSTTSRRFRSTRDPDIPELDTVDW